jgi:hypothetical protein
LREALFAFSVKLCVELACLIQQQRRRFHRVALPPPLNGGLPAVFLQTRGQE